MAQEAARQVAEATGVDPAALAPEVSPADAAAGKPAWFSVKLEDRHFAAFEKWAMPLRGVITASSLLTTWPALLGGVIGCLLSLAVLLPIGAVPGWLKAGYPLLALVYLIAAAQHACALQRQGMQVHARQIRQLVEQSGELHSQLAPLLQAWFRRGAGEGGKPDYKGLLRQIMKLVKSALEFSLPDLLAASLRRQLMLVLSACLIAWLPVILFGQLGAGWGLAGICLAALGCSLAPLSLLLVRRLSSHWALMLGSVDGLLAWLRELRVVGAAHQTD